MQQSDSHLSYALIVSKGGKIKFKNNIKNADTKKLETDLEINSYVCMAEFCRKSRFLFG